MQKGYLPKTLVLNFILILNMLLAQHIYGQGIAQSKGTPKCSLKWQVNPLDDKIFIENKGQLPDMNNSKILYQASLGDVKAFFTASGVIYRYDKICKDSVKKKYSIVSKYLTAEWNKTNKGVTVTAEQEKQGSYIYPAGINGTIKTNAFKKITYKNIYNGIDIEYTFPKNKEGIKYNIVVHPGADMSMVKLIYQGATKSRIDESGNVIFSSDIGEITDHAPVSYYQSGGSVKVAYTLKGNEESFEIKGNYDKSATIVIDPWTTNPAFSGSYNKAYDADYDDNGNIYAYGGYNPFQLVKMNSAGVIQWTFNASTIDGVIYGDFAVDKVTGTSYIAEGAHATGARVLKVNTLGVLQATFPGDSAMNEMWRTVFNPCSHTLVIGAGGTSSNSQACILDTNMSSLTIVNALGATSPGHSMVFTTIDPSGGVCYMGAAKSAVLDTAKFNNVILKMPLPTLTPTAYIAPDGYKFVELASVNYVGPGAGSANGFNGMAASPNWLYLSDGSVLKQVNKNTGSIVNSINLTGTSFAWGGLDADMCDNVYAGAQSSVNIYTPALTLSSTVALPGIVYDVILGLNQQTLITCGRAFVAVYSINSSLSASKVVVPAECGCNGSAKVTLTACGSIDTTGLTYSWSNGETTRTATNLCAGTYTVSILSGCSAIFKDTVTVPSHFLSINQPSPNICTGGNGVSLNAGGASTYVWAPSTGLSATTGAIVTANPASSTTYTVTGTTGTGCKDSIIIPVVVNLTPTITVTAPVKPVCPNSGTILTVSGATSYIWKPSGPLNCSTCTSVTADINGNTTFTVIGNSLGCTDTVKVSLTVYPVPTITVKTTPTACDTFDGTASATVSGSEPYTYSWSPAGGTNVNATGLSQGVYVISVRDTNGCITSQTCTVNVTPSPSVIATNDPATCDSSNGKAIAIVTGGTGPYKYLWSPGSNTNATDSKLGSGIYSVLVTDANGCTGNAFTILEDTGAGVQFSARNDVLCFGGSTGGATVIMTGATSPYIYSWSTGATTSSVNNLSVGEFTVTVTDAHGCRLIDTLNINQPNQVTGTITPANIFNVSCFGGSNGKISVTPGGGVSPYTYLWNDGQTGDTAKGIKAGKDTVTITDKNGCKTTANDSVSQPDSLIVHASSSAATCGNNGTASAIAVGGTPGYNFNWGASGIGSTIYSLGKGTYTVTVTDSHGCTDTASTKVDTLGQTATIKSSENEKCNGGKNGGATVSVIGGDTSLYGYSWSPKGGNNATASGIPAGIYTITVTYIANGCTVFVYDTITQPPAITSSVKYKLMCGNKVVAIDSSSGGQPPYSYTWTPSGAKGDSATLPSGSYTLTVTDTSGCSTAFSLTAPPTDPVAKFTPVPDTVLPGDTVKFINLSSSANSWYWTFGDGNTSTDSLPFDIYYNGGTYVVYLKATNSLGCTDSVAETVFVKEGIAVPNVFTPNGDGINDVFHVNAYGLQNYKIDIFDRWGLLIFEGTGEYNDWTGRDMSGIMVSQGTYFYVITASDHNGKSFNQKGFLTLIR